MKESATERRAAFEREALVHLRLLWATARRLERDPATAEDLVQETVLRAYRTFDNFRRGTNAVAWLLTILYSIRSNRLRRSRLEPEGKSDEQLQAITDLDAKRTDWETLFLDRALAGRWGAGEAVDAALDELPHGFREVVLLVDLADLTYEEAAEAIGCPVGTVRSRLARARRVLAEHLADHAARLGIKVAESEG